MPVLTGKLYTNRTLFGTSPKKSVAESVVMPGGPQQLGSGVKMTGGSFSLPNPSGSGVRVRPRKGKSAAPAMPHIDRNLPPGAAPANDGKNNGFFSTGAGAKGGSFALPNRGGGKVGRKALFF